MIPTFENDFSIANTVICPCYNYGVLGPSSSKSLPISALICATVVRHPGDPKYLSDIELQNIVIGSRWRIERASDGLLIAGGVAASTSIILPDQPAYNENMLFLVKVRKASVAPYYTALETYGVLGRGGVAIWIDQKID